MTNQEWTGLVREIKASGCEQEFINKLPAFPIKNPKEYAAERWEEFKERLNET